MQKQQCSVTVHYQPVRALSALLSSLMCNQRMANKCVCVWVRVFSAVVDVSVQITTSTALWASSSAHIYHITDDLCIVTSEHRFRVHKHTHTQTHCRVPLTLIRSQCKHPRLHMYNEWTAADQELTTTTAAFPLSSDILAPFLLGLSLLDDAIDKQRPTEEWREWLPLGSLKSLSCRAVCPKSLLQTAALH